MELQKKKCSLSKHLEVDAISYCQECKKYFCNKCQNFHSEMFMDHKIINLNKLDEVFIDKCKEDNHNDKLNSFVKIIILYAVQVASLKLKKKDMVNTKIVMFIILKK